MFVIIQETRVRRMNSLAGGSEERNPDVCRNRSCATESRIVSTEATKRKDFAAVRLLAIHQGHTKGTNNSHRAWTGYSFQLIYVSLGAFMTRISATLFGIHRFQPHDILGAHFSH